MRPKKKKVGTLETSSVLHALENSFTTAYSKRNRVLELEGMWVISSDVRVRKIKVCILSPPTKSWVVTGKILTHSLVQFKMGILKPASQGECDTMK